MNNQEINKLITNNNAIVILSYLQNWIDEYQKNCFLDRIIRYSEIANADDYVNEVEQEAQDKSELDYIDAIEQAQQAITRGDTVYIYRDERGVYTCLSGTFNECLQQLVTEVHSMIEAIERIYIYLNE